MWFRVVQRWRMGLVFSVLPVGARTQEIRVVDDSDLSISYAGDWRVVSGKHLVGGSVKLTRQKNATASLLFNGTGISVFGKHATAGGHTTSSLYSIDGESPTTYTSPSDLDDIQHPVQLYTSPPLSNGPHTLVITNMNQDSWFWLDFLHVTQPAAALPTVSNLIRDMSHLSELTTITLTGTAPSTAPSTVPSTTTPTTVPATPSSTSFTSSAVPTMSTPATSTLSAPVRALASSGKQVSTPAVVIIAISSIVLLALAVFFTYWWRRRRIQKKLQRGLPQIEPFERPNNRRLPPPLLLGTTHPYVVEHFLPSPSTDLALSPSGHVAEKASTIHRPRTVPPPDEHVTDIVPSYGYR